MAWSRSHVDERKKMVAEWEKGTTIAELARRYGVSRPTIYEYVDRFENEGMAGLEDRSRAPHSNPRQTSAAVVHALLNMKDRYPRWGPEKLVRLLLDEGIVLAGPTARDILRRNGRVEARRARPRLWSPSVPPHIVIPGAGHTMSADHKGQFRMQNRRYCYPLTIADPASRFVFAIDALSSKNGALAGPVFERLFQEWGLPEQILTDNGTPFCTSHSIGGISPLSKGWIRLGIQHVRIQPGRPQQNGVHERMHRTLKSDATSPPEKDLRRQQGRFDAFRQEFNHLRPHQALGQERPCTRVKYYRRQHPGRLPEIEYPSTFEVRRVHGPGLIKWQGKLIFVSEVLTGEWVGLSRVDDHRWQLFFAGAHLADWDGITGKFVRLSPKTSPSK